MSTPGGSPTQPGPPAARRPGATEFSGKPPTADWRKYARASLWTVVVLLILLVLASNLEDVTVNLIFADVTVPLVVALGAALGVGLLVGLSIGWLTRRRHDKRAIAAAKGKKK